MTIDTVGLTYDALGRMIQQNRAGVYTQILYSPVGKTAIMSGQTRKTINLPLPGGATAVYDTTFHYRYSDWLGSSRFSSTASRTKFSDDAYAPYGENYAESGTVDPSFTGNDQDTVSGTYDFLFREYNANQGRWILPDPAGLGAVSLGDPQTWNRYAYVRNSPLNSVDLLGLLGPWDDVAGSGRRSILHPGYSWITLLTTWNPKIVDQMNVGNCDGCFVPIWDLVPSFFFSTGGIGPPEPANNARSKLDQIVNHLQQCGGHLLASCFGWRKFQHR